MGVHADFFVGRDAIAHQYVTNGGVARECPTATPKTGPPNLPMFGVSQHSGRPRGAANRPA